MQIIDFQWWRCRDGYLLRGKGENTKLTSASGRFEQYRPLEIESLFAVFGDKTPSSARGMQEFCSRFGLLVTSRPDHLRLEEPAGDVAQVGPLLIEHRAFRHALHLFHKGETHGLSHLLSGPYNLRLVRTELRVGPDGRLKMVLVPPTLLHAIWLQFTLFACSNARLLSCARCNSPFIVGHGTGRRSTSKWCSNACKVAAFKERQAQKEESQ